MVLLIDQRNRAQHSDTLDEAHRLRHEVFVEEMGWNNLRSDDGRERDAFDRDDVVEMIRFDGGEVVGYQRLLPTTRPYLLSEIYPQLCDGEAPKRADLFEWTRFAVKRGHRGDGKSLGPVALDLVTSFVEWGLTNGVPAVVVEMTPVQLLRFAICHFRVHPLGIAHEIGGEEIIAVRAEFDERTLSRLRRFRGNDAPALRQRA